MHITDGSHCFGESSETNLFLVFQYNRCGDIDGGTVDFTDAGSFIELQSPHLLKPSPHTSSFIADGRLKQIDGLGEYRSLHPTRRNCRLHKLHAIHRLSYEPPGT
jgi:hypothetical protein